MTSAAGPGEPLLIATTNRGKAREIAAALAMQAVRFVALDDAGIGRLPRNRENARGQRSGQSRILQPPKRPP